MRRSFIVRASAILEYKRRRSLKRRLSTPLAWLTHIPVLPARTWAFRKRR